MKVEGNELSVFSFMFATGTAAGVILSESELFPNHSYKLTVLSFYFTILSATLSAITLSRLKSSLTFHRKETSVIFLAAAFLFSGIFGAYALYETYSWNPSSENQTEDGHQFLSEILAYSSQSLKDLIDSIPYNDNSSNAMVKALITGDKSDLSIDLTTSFRKSGASHLLALSGMHLGIIYIIISRILSLTGNSPAAKKLKSLTSVTVAGFYSLMTGAGPSIARAFLFICINETARWTNRTSRPASIFCTALIIQLMLSPGSIMSAGFQLSYLAMAGIYFLYPAMKNWYGSFVSVIGKTHTDLHKTRFDPIYRLWDAAALSISCQIFTAPVAWIHFESFPINFLITNIIAVPLTTISIQMAIIATALHSAGFCPDFITEISELTISTLIFCVSTIGEC